MVGHRPTSDAPVTAVSLKNSLLADEIERPRKAPTDPLRLAAPTKEAA
jgi:hypothetical protein